MRKEKIRLDSGFFSFSPCFFFRSAIFFTSRWKKKKNAKRSECEVPQIHVVIIHPSFRCISIYLPSLKCSSSSLCICYQIVYRLANLPNTFIVIYIYILYTNLSCDRTRWLLEIRMTIKNEIRMRNQNGDVS
jgi:hypothetical protein